MFTSLGQFGLGVAVAFSGNYYFFVVLRFLLAMVSSVCGGMYVHFLLTVSASVSVPVAVCAYADTGVISAFEGMIS